MNRKAIGPVVVEWDAHLLTVRATLLSVRAGLIMAVILLIVAVQTSEAVIRYGWTINETRGVFVLLLALPVLYFDWRLWRERCILDRATNAGRDRDKEHGALDDMQEAQVVPFRPVYSFRRHYRIAIRHPDGSNWLPALTTFQQEAEAQYLASIINAFLHQSTPPERPDIWPPPPRGTGANLG